MRDWRGKPDKGSIDEKPPELNEEIWEKNRKIIDIVNEKTFQLGLKIGKEKPKICGERRDFNQEETKLE